MKPPGQHLHEVFPLLLGIFQVGLQSASWVDNGDLKPSKQNPVELTPLGDTVPSLPYLVGGFNPSEKY